MRTLPADEFPRLAEPEGDAVTLDAAAFAAALNQVVPAASADDSRPILTGVLLAAEAGGLRLVATDSYRLAVRDLPGTSVLGEGQKRAGAVAGPGRAGRVLVPTDEVTLRLGERDAAFEVGDRAAHDPPDRGRVPELPGPDPAQPAEPAHRRPRARCSTRCAG